MSSTLQLNDDFDLDIQNNNFVLVDGISALRDRLRTNLRTFKGEWYLDPQLGVPYFSTVFKKPVNFGALNTVFSNIIRGTEGVKSLNSLSLDLNSSTRELTVDFRVSADNGTILEETFSVGV